MKKTKYIVLLIALNTLSSWAQERQVEILASDNISYRDEVNYPGANILVGDVRMRHEGAILTCKKAYFYDQLNFFKAVGDVKVNQGDTLIQTSDYLDYDGNLRLSKSWGNVVMRDPDMTLKTDTLNFDRNTQILYYDTPGTIVDSTNVLKSKRGRYNLGIKRFTAENDVSITNPQDTIYSDKLVYYPENGKAYLYGPSHIYSKDTYVYTEQGFYDSENQISYLTKKSRIHYDDRIIQGDSLYYNEGNSFASATGNIKVTDTINDMVTKGGYAEVYKDLDSLFITKRAVNITELEKDSLYIHGDTLLVTGPSEERIIKAFHYVKFFKTDFRGKCDSLISIEHKGITKMYYDPVVWADDNQITGDSIFMLSNLETEQLDSLKIMNNAFMVSKDSVGYNQIRGKYMLGKFIDNDLYSMLVNGNAEVINYAREDDGELVGITKKQASNIKFYFRDNQVSKINFISQPDGKTYPLSQFPEAESKLKGFIWREDEKPKVITDIFIHGTKITQEVELSEIKPQTD
ncbi:hypothetical protein N9L20_08605 [Flavobacteriaceae bacterium]|nr:hypothetical protein [Flavobacteriaceae bacterium]